MSPYRIVVWFWELALFGDIAAFNNNGSLLTWLLALFLGAGLGFLILRRTAASRSLYMSTSYNAV
jgi:hypothetical protein